MKTTAASRFDAMTTLTMETLKHARARRFYDELQFALSCLDGNSLKAWGVRSSERVLALTGRRVGGLATLITRLAVTGGSEVNDLLAAFRQQRTLEHIGNRAAAVIDGTIGLGHEGVSLVARLAGLLRRDPKKTVPVLLAGLLGFEAGSGGLDGNGGIPDLDLMMGIGAHRSALTHTLIIGIVAEGMVLALADLAAEVHCKLPLNHDPLWDGLARIGRPLTQSLAIGTSAGLAYHLLVDALIQPAALHGLPIDLPMEGHQVILAASGIAEANDALHRTENQHGMQIVQAAAPARSTGRKVVDSTSKAAADTSAALVRGSKRIASEFSKWSASK